MKITFEAKITLIITALCLIVFVLFHYYPAQLGSVCVLNGKFNTGSVTDYLSTIGYIFGHASPEHLLGNLSFFLVLSWCLIYCDSPSAFLLRHLKIHL